MNDLHSKNSDCEPRLGELGELQIDILRVLWKRGKSTVREVQEAMAPNRPLAYTTVLTVLRNLDKRGLVSHDSCKTDRMYRYSAIVTSRDAFHGVIGNLTDKLFAGSAAQLVCYILENDMCSGDDLDLIRELVLRKTVRP